MGVDAPSVEDQTAGGSRRDKTRAA